jgi:hypothetical protein
VLATSAMRPWTNRVLRCRYSSVMDRVVECSTEPLVPVTVAVNDCGAAAEPHPAMNVEGTASITRHPTTTSARRILTRLAAFMNNVIVNITNPHRTETSVGRTGNFPPPCGALLTDGENISVSVLLAPADPGVMEVGKNVPVAPAGRPLIDRATEFVYGPPDGGTVIVTTEPTLRLTITGPTTAETENVAFTAYEPSVMVELL